MNPHTTTPPFGAPGPTFGPTDGAPISRPGSDGAYTGFGGGSDADGVAGPDNTEDLLLTPSKLRSDARARLDAWKKTVARVKAVEGPRGLAVRWSVALRYVCYLAVIIGCAAICHATLAGTRWSSGGTLMLFSAALQTVTAAVGCMFMPHKRTEIVDDLRQFLFQITVLPGTAIVVFYRVVTAWTNDPRNADGFSSLLNNSLPLIYMFTVFVPAVVFVKAVTGRRTLDKSQQDDAEMMQTWTRQDPFVW